MAHQKQHKRHKPRTEEKKAFPSHPGRSSHHVFDDEADPEKEKEDILSQEDQAISNSGQGDEDKAKKEQNNSGDCR